jgi:hypothetical protein
MSTPGMADRHGWINTETLKTRFGELRFVNGYPTLAAAATLLDQLTINRAIEVYLTQMQVVAMIEQRRGLREFGARRASDVVVWESLMDAETLLLTANTETVYAMGYLDLNADGPTVVEAPPKMLGVVMDMLQRYLVDVGPLGPDKGEGGKFLFLPPGHEGEEPAGYFVVKSPTYGVCFGLRGFRVNGTTDEAVGLMKGMRIYPLGRAGDAPPMKFLNGSHQPIDTIHADTFDFFEQLSALVNEEPADVFTPLERFYMLAIGIEKGKRFAPDAKMKELLTEGVRVAAAMARANSFASRDPDTYYYPNRRWQGLSGTPFDFVIDGVLRIDRRAFVQYMAIGNSPAMIAKNVGAGSQYLWTYKDAAGDFLDGAQNYRLRVSPNVPINNFWSVVVYDSLSRSQLQNGQAFPSVSQYTNPTVNADGSVDIYFGPVMPAGQEHNWIRTVPGRGWFPIFRFYGPLEPFFDKTWTLRDIERR